ncbi:hypothetical protein QUW33_07290 [Lactobacillus gallinarum]|uniref:hypothetical protein n=1 Tax=Lactobacillus gallinarum TaxID=52242 RepID=UPI0025A387E6|nr:hypothetical protein [Lactobacillus gallinarum]MDM8277224.1 hypothetical protein [Lactobacillus gallinarum]
MKNVKEIAKEIDPLNVNSQKLRQHIRDEIKRQHIEVKKDLGKIVIEDDDAKLIVRSLIKDQAEKDSARNDEDSSIMIKKLQDQIKQKDTEITRLNKKIEDYADDFKKISLQQQQLTNQQQQLQAKMLQSQKQLKDQSNLNDNLSSENEKLNTEIEKMKKATFWQRLFKQY